MNPDNIKQKITQLRDYDKLYKVFRSDVHRYAMWDTVGQTDLLDTLPADYREFITSVCNGIAGPYYGLYPFGEAINDYHHVYPFDKSKLIQNSTISARIGNEVTTITTDFIPLSYYGDEAFVILVLHPQYFGQVWFYDTSGDYPAAPIMDGETVLDFAKWYEKWLDEQLNKVNEYYETLDFRGQNLTELPDFLANYQQARVLNLNHNNFEQVPDVVFELKNLEIIYLSHNKLTQIPKQIYELEKLKEIYLDNNNISADQISELKRRRPNLLVIS